MTNTIKFSNVTIEQFSTSLWRARVMGLTNEYQWADDDRMIYFYTINGFEGFDSLGDVADFETLAHWVEVSQQIGDDLWEAYKREAWDFCDAVADKQMKALEKRRAALGF
jgi:hypothetical protein